MMMSRGDARSRRSYDWYLVPAILVVVALIQITRVYAVGQSAWKGGGFGMFSTIDSHGARFLRAYLIRGDRQLAVPIPGHLDDLARRCRIVPTQRNLELLAGQLAACRWVRADFARRALEVRLNGGSERLVVSNRVRAWRVWEPLPEGDDEIEFDEIRLEYWQLTYDRGSGCVTAHPRNDVQVSRERP